MTPPYYTCELKNTVVPFMELGVRVARRKIQEGDLEHSFGKIGLEITLRHPNAVFQSAAGDPGYRERITKRKVSHIKQCRFSPCS